MTRDELELELHAAYQQWKNQTVSPDVMEKVKLRRKGYDFIRGYTPEWAVDVGGRVARELSQDMVMPAEGGDFARNWTTAELVG
jgi:hypothetical protein